MKTERVVEALDEAVQSLGVEVRRERGNFRGGLCTVAGRRVVVLNRRRPAEAHLAVLAEALRRLGPDEVYLRPAVRDAVETAWADRTSGLVTGDTDDWDTG